MALALSFTFQFPLAALEFLRTFSSASPHNSKRSMDLLSLPVEIVTEICGSWLTIVNIATLDTAFCSHSARASFLATAFSMDCCLSYEPADPENIDFSDQANVWIVRRRARVPGLHITESLFAATATEYFMSHGKFLAFIVFCLDDAGEEASDETVVWNIVDFCQNIGRLDVRQSLSMDGVAQIVRKCRLLEEVVIEGGQATCSCVAELNAAPHLRRLAICNPEAGVFITCPTLEWIAVYCSPHAIVDDAFGVVLAQSCPHLEMVTIDRSAITDTTVYAIAAHCRDLYSFLSGSDGITSAALEQLTESCSLRELSINITPDTDLSAVAKNSPELNTLWIANSLEEDGDECLIAVAEHCPKLCELVLGNWYLDEEVTGFCAVAERCHNLTDLYFNWPLEIPGPAFCAAIRQCKSLQVFSLSEAVTDDLLHALSCCHMLEVVELTDEAQRTSEASIFALVKGCPALEELTLPKHAEITMSVVRALSRCCPELSVLECTMPAELRKHFEVIHCLLPYWTPRWQPAKS
jgi:hypothetical protein